MTFDNALKYTELVFFPFQVDPLRVYFNLTVFVSSELPSLVKKKEKERTSLIHLVICYDAIEHQGCGTTWGSGSEKLIGQQGFLRRTGDQGLIEHLEVRQQGRANH